MMSASCDSISKRFHELLNAPYDVRCANLPIFFENCSTRDICDLFPTFLRSVFGLDTEFPGWGLRTTTMETATHLFEILHPFFSLNGPVFSLIYRLLNDAYKFEFDAQQLPRKFLAMLQSGQYPSFYSEIMCIDAFQQSFTSLSLNAFDFYMLHFVLHSLQPLHRKYPTALYETENLRSVYITLTAEYLHNFLPPCPGDDVQPSNIAAAVKLAQPLPCQPIQPTRQPRFIKTSRLFNNNTNFVPAKVVDQIIAANAEKARSQTWRTESVLFFYLDSLLSVDIEGEVILPGNEFVRVLRLFIKYVHAFGNAAPKENSTMLGLRKIAQPMIKVRLYTFLMALIKRWPLDSSMNLLLDLWLTYIQPWRYVYGEITKCGPLQQPPLTSRFDAFISENILFYTQIFVHMLPRFTALDYTVPRNVYMLTRLVLVFTQEGLSERLRIYEKMFVKNDSSFDSPQRRMNYNNPFAPELNGCNRDTYRSMFGQEIEFTIKSFLTHIYETRLKILIEINLKERKEEDEKKSTNLINRWLNSIFGEETDQKKSMRVQMELTIQLEHLMESLAELFNISVPNLNITQEEISMHVEQQMEEQCAYASLDGSSFLEPNLLTPEGCRRNIDHLPPTEDPALVPVRTNEVALLVHLLTALSNIINESFCEQIEQLYTQSSFAAKALRLILLEPVTVQRFQRKYGVKTLQQYHLPPRLCLRPLASYPVLITLAVAMFFGLLIFGSSITGILILFVFYLIIAILRALIL